MLLLTRETFRDICLKRDKSKCVVCKKSENVTVHHILDRKLFENGGYYINNGATVCEECHWEAELGNITPQEIRNIIGIKTAILPENYDSTKEYDKWGRVC